MDFGCRLLVVSSGSSKTTRWLDLIAFLLQHRFPVTREQIFEDVEGYRAVSPAVPDTGEEAGVRERESARRKFERDKDELRALGIKIETVEPPDADEPTLGYRLRAGDFYLPYLEIDGPHLVAERPYAALASVRLSVGDLATLNRATQRIAQRTDYPLSRAARSARRKLAFDLPIPLGRIERVLAQPLTEQTASALEVLQQAVAEHHAVRCRYYSIGRDVEEEREIEPHGLFFNMGQWYCVGCPRGQAPQWRVFRVDRVRDVKMVPARKARFEPDPKFSVRDYVGRSAWELSEHPAEPVRVRFAFPESRWVLAKGLGRAVAPLTDDGGAEIEFAVRDRNPFLRWLLTFRDHAKVLGPAGVVDELASLRQRVAALYETDWRS